MPTYDYRCEANGRVVEVVHRMSEQLRTWGELCDRAGVEAGDTPTETPVVRMATGGTPITGSGSGSAESLAPCATGSCCPGGVCGLG
jgi:hypothetical protein